VHNRHIYISIVFAALFTKAKLLNQHRCSTKDEWKRKYSTNTNLQVMVIVGEEIPAKSIENIFNKIIAENCPILRKSYPNTRRFQNIK
jgi:hypothetical protein